MISATTLLFFGFVGFDEVCCLSSRAKNSAPRQRSEGVLSPSGFERGVRGRPYSAHASIHFNACYFEAFGAAFGADIRAFSGLEELFEQRAESRTVPLALMGTLIIAAAVSFTAQISISLISAPGSVADFGVAFEQMGAST